MNSSGDRQIVPGITISPSGQATVDQSLADVLFDLALKLEERMPYPVDVEHVLAALLLARRHGEIASDTRLAADDESLTSTLTKHVTTVFTGYGGKVGKDD